MSARGLVYSAPLDWLWIVQRAVEPTGPTKHAVCAGGAGARTVAVAREIGAGHSLPVAFQ